MAGKKVSENSKDVIGYFHFDIKFWANIPNMKMAKRNIGDVHYE